MAEQDQEQSWKTILCRKHIAAAFLTIHTHISTIKELFRNRKVAEVNYAKGIKEIALEIKFGTAHLACLFNEKNICDVVFIFLDNPADICYYKEVCTSSFPYNNALKGWVHNDCCIQIDSDNDKYSLLILPIDLAKNL